MDRYRIGNAGSDAEKSDALGAHCRMAVEAIGGDWGGVRLWSNARDVLQSTSCKDEKQRVDALMSKTNTTCDN